MDYALAAFDGFHFAHVAARQEHLRLKRLQKFSLDALFGRR